MRITSIASCLHAANVVNRFVARCTASCSVQFRFLKEEFDFSICFISTSSLSGNAFATVSSLYRVFGVTPKCYSNSHLDFMCEFEVPFSKDKEVQNV